MSQTNLATAGAKSVDVLPFPWADRDLAHGRRLAVGR